MPLLLLLLQFKRRPRNRRISFAAHEAVDTACFRTSRLLLLPLASKNKLLNAVCEPLAGYALHSLVSAD